MEDSIDLNTLQDRAAALVDEIIHAGADAADSIVAASRTSGVEIRDGKLEETESAENSAFSVRAFIGTRSASISANVSDDIKSLARRVVDMAKVSPNNPNSGLAPEELLTHSIPNLDLLDLTDPGFDQMQSIATECEEAALAVSGVSKSSGASFGRTLGGTVLATSHGFSGSYQASRFGLSVSAVAGDGSEMERDYDFDSQHHFGDLRSAGEIGKVAGERAAARVNPQRVKTQTANIVFDPRMARSLVGHLAGAVNGASIVRKTSFLRDDLGKQIFKDGVSVLDEPKILRGVASRPFDGEGVTGETLNIVEDGVLQSWLLDSTHAAELGLKTNGRANRAGSNTSPGSTNLTLSAGNILPQDMIADIKSGFYVTELIGQGVNLISGDYSRGASGFWIENGQLTFAVSEVTIAGNLRDMFARMCPASDLDKRHGTNSPTVLIEGMTIAGE